MRFRQVGDCMVAVCGKGVLVAAKGGLCHIDPAPEFIKAWETADPGPGEKDEDRRREKAAKLAKARAIAEAA